MKDQHRFWLLLLFLFWLPFRTMSQQNDFQGWTSAQINCNLNSKLRLQAEEEFRLQENCSQPLKQIHDFGLSYRLHKRLRMTLVYRLQANWKNADTYVWQNGFYTDLTYKVDPGRFAVSYRLRLQSSEVQMKHAEETLFEEINSRHKVTIEYNIRGIPVAPFIEGELFLSPFKSQSFSVTDFRVWAGIAYQLNKLHEFTLRYGIDREVNTSDPLTAYVLALGYTLNLKLFGSGDK
jgi:hypothetical protein